MQSSTLDKVIAVLAAIGGAIETIVSLAFWGVSSLFIAWVTVLPLRGEESLYGPFYAVVLLVLGIAGLVFAIGAWGGHHWARELGLMLYTANVLAGLLYMALHSGFVGFTFLAVSGTLMSLVILVFLLTRRGNEAFSRKP
jgi:hypothetical protein